ncbi:MAG: sulfide/dihydroorotate dehydrogenase-like FAD/NAD-binding protein [Candidatus Fimadaptatus sp.]
MYKVLDKELLAPGLMRIDVYAPDVAAKAQPGQFVIVRVVEEGERVPLTIGGADAERGAITLLVQMVGLSTTLMGETPVGGEFASVTGPLGNPTHFGDAQRILCIGGGVGTAVLYPQVKYLAGQGRYVDVIEGARTENLLVLQKELGALANHLYIATNDGSKGKQGFVTDVFNELIAQGEHYDLVIAIGPPIMMKVVAEATRPLGIRTLVSLNPIMVDGTGMCGGCRVTVGGKVRYACVDGPEFDGHEVDFDGLMRRLGAYREQERKGLEDHKCRIGGIGNGN